VDKTCNVWRISVPKVHSQKNRLSGNTVRLRGMLTFFEIPMVNFSQNYIQIVMGNLIQERKVRHRWRHEF